MKPSKPPKTALPLRGLAILLAVCGGLTLWLIPRDRDVIERLFQDGFFDQASNRIQRVSVEEREDDPGFYQWMEARVAYRHLLIHYDHEVLLGALQSAASGFAQYKAYREELLGVYSNLLQQARSPERIREPLAQTILALPDASRLPLMRLLSRRLLAENQPALAAAAFADFNAGSKLPRTADVLEEVRLWRLSGQPEKGLTALNAFLAHPSRGEAAPSLQLVLLKTQLLRESGQAAPAFEWLYQQSARQPNLRSDETVRGQLVELSLESERTETLIPWLKEWAEQDPNRPVHWRSLAKLCAAAGDQSLAIQARERLLELTPEDADNRLGLAQLYEWNQEPGRAFDLYLQLVREGSVEAAERLFALNPGLYRDVELVEAMESSPELAEEAGLHLDLARLQTNVGHFEAAKANYEIYLEKEPANATVLMEYGSLLLALFDDEAARTVFLKARALAPDTVQIGASIAETYVNLGAYEQALDAYREYLNKPGDEMFLDDFITLAESVGRADLMREGLLRKIELDHALTPTDFLDLAYLEYQRNETGARIDALQKGMERYPENDEIKTQLAYALSDEGDTGRALRVIRGHGELSSNQSVALLYLQLLVSRSQHRAAAQFIAAEMDSALKEAPSIQAVRAELAEANGDLKLSASLYRKLYQNDPRNARFSLNYARLLSGLNQAREAERVLRPWLDSENPAALEMISQVYAAAGKFKKALAYQKRYLETQPADRSRAWGSLGDIYLSMGEAEQAKSAYQKGLNHLLARLEARDTE